MFRTTQALVLHTTKYAETSIIAQIFTRELGVRSYIVKGIRSAKSRSKQNMLQPLSHLDMCVYDNPGKQLQYIKEMHPANHYNNIYSHNVKMALMFFMDEVLYKSLKEAEPNTSLFDFVVEQISSLDTDRFVHESYLSAFPIHFLLHTARHLGIEPMDNYSASEPLFNLKEGRFLAHPTSFSSTGNEDYFLDTLASNNFHQCLTDSLQHDIPLQLSSRDRATTLSNILEYYHIHLPDFNNFTSHQILHSVLR